MDRGERIPGDRRPRRSFRPPSSRFPFNRDADPGPFRDRGRDPDRRDAPPAEEPIRPPMIIAKPPPRKIVNDDEEEWPSITSAATSASAAFADAASRSRSGSRSVKGVTAPGTPGESRRMRHESPYHEPSTSASSQPRARSGYSSGDREREYRMGQGYGGGGPKPSGRPLGPTSSMTAMSSYSIQQKGSETSLARVGSELSSSSSQPKMPAVASAANLVVPEPKFQKSSIRLVNEMMDWSDVPGEYLLENNADFLVVGVIGCQGTGKSTIASFIAGNDPTDPYRNYIFRPESKEAVETNQHQTNGIYFYASDERVIVLDTQPVLSPSIINVLIQYDKKYLLDYAMPENFVEVQSLELVAFMLQVCHVIVVLMETVPDISLVRFLQTAEMLKPSLPLSENPMNMEYYPHVVFIHNKASREDFGVFSLQKKCDAMEELFKKSKLRYKGLCNTWRGGRGGFSDGVIESDVNLCLLPDVNFWLKHKFPDKEGFKGHIEYDELIRQLRWQIYECPRGTISSTVTNEKTWFHYAARMWDSVRKSLLISEYGRLLP